MGKPKIRLFTELTPPVLIKIKFGAVDNVGWMTPRAKFYVNLTKGASRQIGEI